MLPRLVVRVDANESVGLGHVMRCIAIAQVWRASGAPVVFAMFRGALLVKDRVASERFDLEELASELAPLPANPRSDVVLIDGYTFDGSLQQRFVNAGVRCVVIDDHARLPAYDADIVVDANVGAREESYRPRMRRGRALCGLRYALLRREFTAAREASVIGARRLLVTFGGSDSSALTERVLAEVDPTFDVTILVGAANKRSMAIQRAAERFNRHRVVINPQNVAEVMASADLAVSAAGTTCTELAFMGVPAVVVVTADNQQPVAEGFARLGCVDVAGGLNVEGADIARRVEALAVDDARRSAMKARGMEAVDGRGCERVVDVIREICA